MNEAAQRTSSPSLGWLDVAEKGSVLGIRALVFIATAFGRAPGRLVIRLIALYYVVFYGSARRASRQYIERVEGRASFFRVVRHVRCFANVTLDRMFMAVGSRSLFDVRDEGMGLVRDLAKKKRGAILLGAHLGSFEAMRMQGEADALRINVVGYFRNAKMINAALERMNPGVNTSVIDVDHGNVGFVLRIKECVARGEMVALLGDRITPNAPSARVNLFGSEASLPTGAYQLAALLRCPIYLTFGLYRGQNRYDVHCELFEEEVRLPRGSREQALRAYAQRFADRLEHFARKAPDNWFNFYDFWRAA